MTKAISEWTFPPKVLLFYVRLFWSAETGCLYCLEIFFSWCFYPWKDSTICLEVFWTGVHLLWKHNIKTPKCKDGIFWRLRHIHCHQHHQSATSPSTTTTITITTITVIARQQLRQRGRSEKSMQDNCWCRLCFCVKTCASNCMLLLPLPVIARTYCKIAESLGKP